MRFWLILAAFTVFMAFPASAEGVAVYELFTARDCPACPGADAVFRKIARTNPDVIALSCHVTYFNRPGRADELSAPFCDGRQTGYKNARVVPKLFTPAVVVNGYQNVKGSDEAALLNSISAAKMETVQKIYLAREGEYLNMTLPNISLRAPAEVWLFAYDSGHAVKYLTKLLRWNGKSVSMASPVGEIPAAGYAVVAQTGNQTNIIAAGKTN